MNNERKFSHFHSNKLRHFLWCFRDCNEFFVSTYMIYGSFCAGNFKEFFLRFSMKNKKILNRDDFSYFSNHLKTIERWMILIDSIDWFLMHFFHISFCYYWHKRWIIQSIHVLWLFIWHSNATHKNLESFKWKDKWMGNKIGILWLKKLSIVMYGDFCKFIKFFLPSTKHKLHPRMHIQCRNF